MRTLNRLARTALSGAWLALAMALTACNGGTSSNAGAATAATALTITGAPPTSVNAGQAYLFQPTVTGAAGAVISFSVTNKPAWMMLNTTNGQLTGRPSATDAGTYPNITLSVHVATGSAALPVFAVAVRANAAAAAVTISGTPAASVTAGSTYTFRPEASAAGGSLTFSAQNLPRWAAFDAATGLISGTPAAADVGTYSGIVVTAMSGSSSASLPAFALSVTPAGSGTGSATLSWTAPSTNADGSALTDLSGFRIYYGNSPNLLKQMITIPTPGISTYVISNLGHGTWYFAIRTLNASAAESALSAVLSKTL